MISRRPWGWHRPLLSDGESAAVVSCGTVTKRRQLGGSGRQPCLISQSGEQRSAVEVFAGEGPSRLGQLWGPPRPSVGSGTSGPHAAISLSRTSSFLCVSLSSEFPSDHVTGSPPQRPCLPTRSLTGTGLRASAHLIGDAKLKYKGWKISKFLQGHSARYSPDLPCSPGS